MKDYWVLLPAIIVSLVSIAFYSMMSESERLKFVDSFFYNNNITHYKLSFAAIGQIYRVKAAKIIFIIQLFLVSYCGLKKLSSYNKEIDNYNSNTDKKTLGSVKYLLLLLALFALFSAIANHIGLSFFIQNSWLLFIPTIFFSVLLFLISYVGYNQSFTVSKWKESVINPESAIGVLNKQLDYLMEEEQLFKQKDLRITDVALQTGSNRTYVSNYINKEMQLSFSDYINSYRIEYAQSLMNMPENLSKLEISELSGFANEASFYRNFKKNTGTTPNEWLKLQAVDSEYGDS